MENLTLNDIHDIKTFLFNLEKSQPYSYNLFYETTKNANTIKEKEIALRNFLEQLGDYAPVYASQRLSDMSFLNDCPDWQKISTSILEEYAS